MIPMDARPNDHARPALSHDLPAHVGNTDQFPPVRLAQLSANASGTGGLLRRLQA